jgi:NAD-dependent SIR2 family protein deacetylase
MDGEILVSDFIEFISKNRLFILGAGFSAGAGIPMIGTLLS